jgi:DNA-binding MarR family transcriptional regulator
MPESQARTEPEPKPARRRRVTRTTRAEVDLGVLEGLAGFYLRQAQDASFRAFARLSGEHGLKPGRFAALMIIRRNPGISQVALARAIARDKSTVTPLVQEFLEQDLVFRHQSKVDRRSFTLTLTPKGEAVLAELERHAATHDRKIDALIGKQKAEFIRLLRKIGDHLR